MTSEGDVNEALNSGNPAEESRGRHHDYEEDDDSYGRRVNKRIGKEVSRRKRAEKARKQAEADARAARERAAALEQRLDEAETTVTDNEVAETKAKLKQAIEDGDTDKQADLMEEMADIKARRRKPVRTQVEPDNDDPGGDEGQPKKLDPSVDAFIDRNAWFKDDPKARRAAIKLERELREEEGYEIGEELYEELEECMFNANPDLAPDDWEGSGDDLDDLGSDDVDDPQDDDGEEDEPPVRRRASPVTSRSNGQGRPRRRQQGDHMTNAMRETMTKYGLNPNDPKQIKDFLKYRKG